ncbi:MAG: sialidase family protein [Thermoanaerobaculia bacterium]
MARRVRLLCTVSTLALVGGWVLASSATAQQLPKLSPRTVITAAPASACALLNDKNAVSRMDGLLWNLIWSCGRQDMLAKLRVEGIEDDSLPDFNLATTDVKVNNTAPETSGSRTQSETSIARNDNTGTICSSYNDSWEFFGAGGGGGFTGFARSTDGGATWSDRGAVGSNSFGDPSLVWRKVDGKFYLATLSSGGGLVLFRSDDDCTTFTQISTPSNTGSDDKEILAVDNTPTSPNYGNLYIVWTNFSLGTAPIQGKRSTNAGITWSAATTISNGGTVQGAWPAVAPNGDVFVAWLRYASFPNGNISVRVARSVNGGTSYSVVTAPLSNVVSPRDSAASTSCGRPALKGNIRFLASPQITVTSDGVLHVVYNRDPDGVFNSGDVVNVYYRRSTNSGSTWSTQFQLNDVGTNDQFFPTIQSRGNTLVAGWYDRRNDAANTRFDYYERTSADSGLTWGANVRVSDVNSPVVLDANLATCYHGDYDMSLVTDTGTVIQWASDRDGTPDVWTDRAP